jgi:phage shock protein PspC (stress-responsive transcriptional regulator)
MSVSDELERLNALFLKGALSSDEYAQAKARVLGQSAADATLGASASAGTSAGSAGAGSGASAGATHGTGFLRRLARSSSDRVLGGVCGGLGAHTGLPSWAWRVMFCVTAIYFGIGILFYVLMWIFVPQDAPTS